jgi:hypothetical protein
MISLGVSLDGERLENLSQPVKQENSKKGAINITKSTCLFTCQL